MRKGQRGVCDVHRGHSPALSFKTVPFLPESTLRKSYKTSDTGSEKHQDLGLFFRLTFCFILMLKSETETKI